MDGGARITVERQGEAGVPQYQANVVHAVSLVSAPAPISPLQKARILAEALPFIRAFHASTLIIRFGGGAMADPVLKEGFARDVALLRLVGMNPIIVHGGGWRIDDLLQTMGLENRRQDGVRVTDEPDVR